VIATVNTEFYAFGEITVSKPDRWRGSHHSVDRPQPDTTASINKVGKLKSSALRVRQETGHRA
jgi:hypothetical protein